MEQLKEKQEQEQKLSEDARHDDELLKTVNKTMDGLKKHWKLILISAAVIIASVAAIVVTTNLNKKEKLPPEPEIDVCSTLTNMVGISRLSTLTSVYDGVAEVRDEKTNDIKYYVAYKSTVKTGIDFKAVEIELNEETNEIHIKVPDASISEIDVDMSSLDFMFMDEKYNKPEVTSEAYAICRKDVEDDCKNQSAIFELARQNAANVLKAMTSPIVEQLEASYTVVVD